RMLDQVSHAARDWKFAVPAYCFMPDHLHVLASGINDDSDLIRFAHAVKRRTGYEYRRLSANDLWQKGYFEHVLRDDEVTEIVMRYILANPVRAGLCTAPKDYPFSGSLEWTKDQLQDLWADTRTV